MKTQAQYLYLTVFNRKVVVKFTFRLFAIYLRRKYETFAKTNPLNIIQYFLHQNNFKQILTLNIPVIALWIIGELGLFILMFSRQCFKKKFLQNLGKSSYFFKNITRKQSSR
jgi:hypothetical protein